MTKKRKGKRCSKCGWVITKGPMGSFCACTYFSKKGIQ